MNPRRTVQDDFDPDTRLVGTGRLKGAVSLETAQAYGVLLGLLVVGTGNGIEVLGFLGSDLGRLRAPVV